MCINASGVADAQSDQPLRILVANFSHRTRDGLPYQVVAPISEHPETLVESNLSHDEMFGLIHYEGDTQFRKRHTSAHDIETIKKYLASHLKQPMGGQEKPVAAEDISMDVPKEK